MPLAKPAFSPLLVAPNISLVVDLKIQDNFIVTKRSLAHYYLLELYKYI